MVLRGGLALAVLILVAAIPLGLTGVLPFAYEPVAGRSAAVWKDVPGPEDGPVCPLDKRYVNESPEGLRPAVLSAWRRLRSAGQKEGVRFCVMDGKRSVAQQQAEFDEAVRKFGSEEQAKKYVLPPDKSMHVQGIAVDVQPTSSAKWVEKNGEALGWCRRYENEYWHFEYDAKYKTDGCPAMLPSAVGS